MIRMVIFDMAGTTVDEDNVVYKTLQKVINLAGYHFTLDQVLALGAGKEKLTAIKDIISHIGEVYDEVLVAKIHSDFLDELAIAYNNFQLKPQKGAEEVFKILKQKKIFVVLNTGYNKKTANTILEKLQWHVGKQIDALITSTDVSNNRPLPDMILLAMQKFNITDAKHVAKVGDSIIDIEEGKNAGCTLTLGITTGAHTEAQLATANPTKIIHHLNELIPMLQ
jgi:phosphonatase-like hydrolase